MAAGTFRGAGVARAYLPLDLQGRDDGEGGDMSDFYYGGEPDGFAGAPAQPDADFSDLFNFDGAAFGGAGFDGAGFSGAGFDGASIDGTGPAGGHEDLDVADHWQAGFGVEGGSADPDPADPHNAIGWHNEVDPRHESDWSNHSADLNHDSANHHPASADHNGRSDHGGGHHDDHRSDGDNQNSDHLPDDHLPDDHQHGDHGLGDHGLGDAPDKLDLANLDASVVEFLNHPFDASHDLIGAAPGEPSWWLDLASDHNHEGGYETVGYDLDANPYVAS